MKIIHILGRPHTVKLPPLGEVHRIDTVNRRYALKTRQYSSKYHVECWWPEKQISHPITAVEDGITFRIFPASHFKFPYKCISLSLVRALKREARKNHVLVFLHGLGGLWTNLLPLFLKDVPFVVQQHCEGTAPKWKKLIRHPWRLPFMILERWAYKHIDHFFLLYHRAEKELERYVDLEKISVQPLGVDFDLFKPIQKAEAKEALGLQPDQHYLLYVGRIERKKGVNYLFEAIPSILREFPENALLVIGRAPRQEFLQQQEELLVKLGVKDRVIFLGEVSNEKLPLYYSAADLLVLPSLTEGFGLVLVEAVACECPFVATSVGGIPELFQTVRHGRLVPPADPEAIARAAIEILKNPSQFKGGRERARVYSWDSIMEKTVQVFEDLRQKYFTEM